MRELRSRVNMSSPAVSEWVKQLESLKAIVLKLTMKRQDTQSVVLSKFQLRMGSMSLLKSE